MNTDYVLTKKLLLACLLVFLVLVNLGIASAASPVPVPTINPVLQKAAEDHNVMRMHNFTNADRQAAADRAATQGLVVGGSPAPGGGYGIAALTIPTPGGVPDYFGPYPNYALSQLPVTDGLGNATPGTGIRKFVDSLPGLGPTGANNLGQYIPIATPDTVSFGGSEYYQIALVQYAEKMHSDIRPTTLRGYVQLETPQNAATSKHYPLNYPNGSNITNAAGSPVYGYEKPHYLGPMIIAQKNLPVRVKFFNYLPTGIDGDLFIPVDTTYMGAGMGPEGVLASPETYSENRATLHLHGGVTPWISDGTPHQWTTPANEYTSYPKGVSVRYVPDMDGGNEPPGVLTFYYTNQQTARLMFYHDHAMGITRLNVYAGNAAPYLVQDPQEATMVTGGAIPTDQIPLVIQDKTFVPSATQMRAQDPTWNWGGNKSYGWPHTGDLWWPHVYMPNQNNGPNSGGANPMGRWDYGPWFWPPFVGLTHGPVANPYYDPVNAPWEPPLAPGTPDLSGTPESFMDTPVVNGNAYPYVQVGPHAYRFRILNACNDRYLNLQLYYAASNATMWNGTTLLNGSAGEVRMVPAIPNTGLPALWPTDGRDGGVPDPKSAGPSWIQIGTEGGFLPAPAIIPPLPVNYDYNRRSITVLDVLTHSLYLGPAERADVIVDFTGIPDGTKLILYNDAPAPNPAFDSRYDFYTGDPNQTSIGGAPTTVAGYGPNTRTIMQIQINASIPATGPAWSFAALNTSLPAQYALSLPPPVVPEARYNAAFGANYPADPYARIQDYNLTFTPGGQATPITMQFTPKGIIEDFDMDYGRLNAMLGTEVPLTGPNVQTSIPYFYADPPTDVMTGTLSGTQVGALGDGTQIWKVTHNGVDTHAIHFHLFNVQVINRVGWDGMVKPPDNEELGWKDTVKMRPLEDIIIAMRPITPVVPFPLPESIRALDPINPLGTSDPAQFHAVDPANEPAPVVNHIINFGYEYVWHCHLLGHEEHDMMRTLAVATPPASIGTPTGFAAGNILDQTNTSTTFLRWIDQSTNEDQWTIQKQNVTTGNWSDVMRIPSFSRTTIGDSVMAIDPTPNSTDPYRVIAVKIIGDGTIYAAPTVGYPYIAYNSTASNAAAPTLNNANASPANFAGTPVSGISPLTVSFTDQSNTATGWDWNFGDGNFTDSQLKNPVHTYLLPGTYNVSLTAMTIGGNVSVVKNAYITVNTPPPPVASFTVSQTSGVAPIAPIFTDTSTNAPTSWNWSFGDGKFAMSRNPIHRYLSAGTYTVTLIASNPGGSGISTRTNLITVTLPPAPVANFTGTPTTGNASLTVAFTDLSTNSPNLWNWSFGDGDLTNYDLQNPVHTYKTPGNFTVSLTASNAGGSNTLTKTGYINVTVPLAPVANFTAVPTTGNAPTTVAFTDLSTNIPISWNWTFGDGSLTNSTVQNPIHTYLLAGNYTVSLNATNLGGTGTMTKVGYINISSPLSPIANFTATPTNGTAPLTVTFTDLSTQNASAWAWTFGDGDATNATLQNPIHTYFIGGNFTVTLTASNAFGSNIMTKVGYITTIATSRIGVVRGDHTWYVDYNGDGVLSGTPLDRIYGLGQPGDAFVTGDWNGNGITEIGVVRGNHTWYVDYNGDGVWSGTPLDRIYGLGQPGDAFVTGDWDGNGITEIGVVRGNHTWYVDYNGDGVWSGTPLDRIYGLGQPGDAFVTGDWDGNGITEIGVVRGNHTWYVDYNGDGVWSGTPLDRIYGLGQPGDTFVTGDWNGNRITEIGVVRGGQTWYLDYNGDGVWSGTPADRIYTFGLPGDKMVTGKW